VLRADVVDQTATRDLEEEHPNNLAPSAETWPLHKNTTICEGDNRRANRSNVTPSVETWHLRENPGDFAFCLADG